MKGLYVAGILAAGLGITAPSLAAEDITSPFFVPSTLEYLSETSVAHERTVYKNDDVQKDLIGKETFQIGAGDEAAIVMSLSNRFNTKHVSNRDYNNELNLDYELGARTTLRSRSGLMMRLGASYYTYNPRSWYGHSAAAKEKIRTAHGNTRWYKELRGDIMLGYTMEDMLTPYISLAVNGNIDDADRELAYQSFAGVHKMETFFSYDAGIRYDFEFGSDSEEAWYMQLGSDYFLTDGVTVGGFADYRFAGSSDPKVSYAYSVEARLKILF